VIGAAPGLLCKFFEKGTAIPVFHYYGYRKGGHAPSHIREAFCSAVEAFAEWDGSGPEPLVEVEVHYQPRKMAISKVCGLLRNCSDILPSSLFDQLAQDIDLRLGRRTYAAGARALHQRISERRAA
jgi:hypothetical protein